jgi:branched-chain amino acid transport system ATP-binding protein
VIGASAAHSPGPGAAQPPDGRAGRPPILAVENLSIAYGKVAAVQDVSLVVRPGATVAVIGPNGAGKTTLLNAIMGLLPSRGAIRYLSRDIRGDGIDDRVGAGLSLVPEKRELFAPMSVEDNLVLGAYARRHVRDGSREADLEAVFARFPLLKERRTQLAGTLSGGERQMLAIARALMGRPRMLMLDEPSLGLAPLIVREVFDILTGLKETGVSILLVEQNARAALQAADEAYVLETGTIALAGPARDLAGHPRVAETYLGLGGRNRPPGHAVETV